MTLYFFPIAVDRKLHPDAVDRELQTLVILNKPYYRYLPEDAAVGTSIIQVKVKDAQIWQRKLNYSIIGGQGLFNINHSTGL